MSVLYTNENAVAIRAEVNYGVYLAPAFTSDYALQVENLEVDAQPAVERSSIYTGTAQNESPLFTNEQIITYSFDVPWYDTSAISATGLLANNALLNAGFGKETTVAYVTSFNILKNGGSCSAIFFKDGVEYIACGCRHDLEIVMEAGKNIKFKVKGMGLFYSATAASTPTPAYAGNKFVYVKDFLSPGLTNEGLASATLKLNATPKFRRDFEGRYGVGEIYLDGWDPKLEIVSHPSDNTSVLLGNKGDALSVKIELDETLIGFPIIDLYDGTDTTIAWTVEDCKPGNDGGIVTLTRTLINPVVTTSGDFALRITHDTP